MVMQMKDVVAHEVVEGRRRVSRHRLPGQLVEVVMLSLSQPHLVRRRLHEPCDVQIVGPPQGDEVLPRRVLVTLHRHPVVLGVAGKDQVVLKLGPYEALMVVGGGVDQASDDLLGRPLAGGRPLGRARPASPRTTRMRSLRSS